MPDCPSNYDLVNDASVKCNITAELSKVHSNFSFSLTFTEPIKLEGNPSDAFSVLLVNGELAHPFSWELK